MSLQTRLLNFQDSTSEHSETAFDLGMFNRSDPEKYPYLLRSSANRQNNTKYDILIACPLYTLTLDAGHVLHCDNRRIENEAGFFDTLEKLYQEDRQISHASEDPLPFTGGWFLYLSYEMAQEVEPCLNLPPLPAHQPLAVAARCPAAIIFDKTNKRCIAVAESAHSHLLYEIEQDYLKLIEQDDNRPAGKNIELKSLSEDDPATYLDQVNKIKHYIVEGDIFQANLSRRWQATLKQDVEDILLFDILSQQNPASFAAMACLKHMTVISSSPERLVSIKNGIVQTRPIAGTRPRDDNSKSDEALADELLAHPKEQAEHIMLIDLERNDLGRVCKPGSIEVDELMTLESWQHVHHIVSNVRGELKQDCSPVDALRAVFPGGTITGCPKVRCMEILAELEQQPRGAYTGSLGYLNNDGSMDLNILIRTMVRDRETADWNDRITFRAGGGIVNDSIPEKELEETRAKAKGLLKIFSSDA